MRIWRYVVRINDGKAPCVDNGNLSLCICKPVIRRGACVGDYVLGFKSKRADKIWNGPRLIWAGVVSEKIKMGDYCWNYSDRQDAIYRRISIYPDGGEELIHYGGGIHDDFKSQQRDIGGKFALLFKPFWYWGDDAAIVPENLQFLAYYRQGQTTKGVNEGTVRELRGWLEGCRSGILRS